LGEASRRPAGSFHCYWAAECGPLETVVAQIKVDEEQKRALTAEYEALEEASGCHSPELRPAPSD